MKWQAGMVVAGVGTLPPKLGIEPEGKGHAHGASGRKRGWEKNGITHRCAARHRRARQARKSPSR